MTTSADELTTSPAEALPAKTEPVSDAAVHEPVAAAEPTTASHAGTPLDDAAAERRRLEAELAAIERKREELSRALIVNAHPELADPIRVLTGRLYAVARVEERMREPLSKAEVRKVESLGKKRESLVLKRAELDAKRLELEAELAQLDHELALLGEERTKSFDRERNDALEQLVVTLAQLGPAFDQAGVDPVRLVEGLDARMADIKATAESLASRTN
ncbi:MAG: hypothetical protein K1X94_24225 [Sandaracinaceae bacterium]|nr:hypothetical protein [Sandaracinaceae bacterium]